MLTAMSASACPVSCKVHAFLILSMLQNELAILEFIHCLVETLDRYFSNVCELDLMFNLEMVRPRLCCAGVCRLCCRAMGLAGLGLPLKPCCATQAHFIVDEMIMNGCIVETNKQNILAPVQLLEKAS